MGNAVRFWWKTFHQALGSGKSHPIMALGSGQFGFRSSQKLRIA